MLNYDKKVFVPFFFNNLSCLLVSVIPKVRLIDFMAHIIVDRNHSGVDITNIFSFSLRNNCVIFYYFSSEFWMLVDFQIYRCLWCRSQCRNDKQSNILLLQKYYLSSRLTDKNRIQMHRNILSILINPKFYNSKKFFQKLMYEAVNSIKRNEKLWSKHTLKTL